MLRKLTSIRRKHALALAILPILYTTFALPDSRASVRKLSRAEMLTSIGGSDKAAGQGQWCMFTQTCMWPNTYTQTCDSLSWFGPSYCTAVTSYTGAASGSCQNDPEEPTSTCSQSTEQVICSTCSLCWWFTDPTGGGASKCIVGNNCSPKWVAYAPLWCVCSVPQQNP
jgi:hypothetical protein